MATQRVFRAAVLGVVVVLVAATAVWWVFLRPSNNKVTAYFDTTVGIYSGSDVRVLGVKVGSVESVTPQGDVVKVVFGVDPSVSLPANAQAAAVAPTVVADRYIQVLPAFSGGPKMANNAVIPRERTATPVELDQLTKSLNTTATALGPDGANSKGALTNLLNTGAANLKGNGAALGDTLTELTKAVDTLSNSRGNLFDTVTNLQSFVSTLAANDQQVQDFTQQLAAFTQFLSGERTDLGAALQQLSQALGQVASFVRDNRDSLSKNVTGLSAITATVAKQRGALAEVLDVAPIAGSNLVNSYDGASGTLDTRLNFNEIADPGVLICNLVKPAQLAPGNPVFDALNGNVGPLNDFCKTVGKGLGGKVVVPTPAVLAVARPDLPALPLPGSR
ncbi:MAG: MCE family protein [Mycobacteriaceae bacterium]